MVCSNPPPNSTTPTLSTKYSPVGRGRVGTASWGFAREVAFWQSRIRPCADVRLGCIRRPESGFGRPRAAVQHRLSAWLTQMPPRRCSPTRRHGCPPRYISTQKRPCSTLTRRALDCPLNDCWLGAAERSSVAPTVASADYEVGTRATTFGAGITGGVIFDQMAFQSGSWHVVPRTLSLLHSSRLEAPTQPAARGLGCISL
jgi:hypothetical protein